MQQAQSKKGASSVFCFMFATGKVRMLQHTTAVCLSAFPCGHNQPDTSDLCCLACPDFSPWRPPKRSAPRSPSVSPAKVSPASKLTSGWFAPRDRTLEKSRSRCLGGVCLVLVWDGDVGVSQSEQCRLTWPVLGEYLSAAVSCHEDLPVPPCGLLGMLLFHVPPSTRQIPASFLCHGPLPRSCLRAVCTAFHVHAGSPVSVV